MGTRLADGSVATTARMRALGGLLIVAFAWMFSLEWRQCRRITAVPLAFGSRSAVESADRRPRVPTFGACTFLPAFRGLFGVGIVVACVTRVIGGNGRYNFGVDGADALYRDLDERGREDVANTAAVTVMLLVAWFHATTGILSFYVVAARAQMAGGMSKSTIALLTTLLLLALPTFSLALWPGKVLTRQSQRTRAATNSAERG